VKMSDIAFCTTNWADVETTRHEGDQGFATWRTQFFGPESNRIRVRMVEYSAGYEADHWCEKGHVLLCLSGELITHLADGREFKLTSGMSYQVADGAEAHRSNTAHGATLFIVD
jgi:hypothetical protein